MIDFKAVMAALFFALLLLAGLSGSPTAQAEDNTAFWKTLKQGGHVVLLRHALAPGTGDPAHFSVDDCTTQRNLNETGRQQSRDIGALMRDAGIDSAQVYSSQWCRCMDTAELLGLGQVQALPVLNSFFRNPGRADGQTRALKDWIRDQSLAQPVVLVTHQVNITALTGVYPSSGELVLLDTRGDELQVAGRLETR
ncbi:histidine phosphatase family protein [Marinobacterium sp. YM272]|uniref:histidine phosphatase family protein n=1 Tax=Marinobacterium sp. YM272 TaxID=3421654 RepID=UPI003D7FFD6F